MTLREVGENLGLTRERVRQLESQALAKLMLGLREAPARSITDQLPSPFHITAQT